MVLYMGSVLQRYFYRPSPTIYRQGLPAGRQSDKDKDWGTMHIGINI